MGPTASATASPAAGSTAADRPERTQSPAPRFVRSAGSSRMPDRVAGQWARRSFRRRSSLPPLAPSLFQDPHRRNLCGTRPPSQRNHVPVPLALLVRHQPAIAGTEQHFAQLRPIRGVPQGREAFLLHPLSERLAAEVGDFCWAGYETEVRGQLVRFVSLRAHRLGGCCAWGLAPEVGAPRRPSGLDGVVFATCSAVRGLGIGLLRVSRETHATSVENMRGS